MREGKMTSGENEPLLYLTKHYKKVDDTVQDLIINDLLFLR